MRTKQKLVLLLQDRLQEQCSRAQEEQAARFPLAPAAGWGSRRSVLPSLGLEVVGQNLPLGRKEAAAHRVNIRAKPLKAEEGLHPNHPYLLSFPHQSHSPCRGREKILYTNTRNSMELLEHQAQVSKHQGTSSWGRLPGATWQPWPPCWCRSAFASWCMTPAQEGRDLLTPK